MMLDFLIVFIFGSCVGSFLNVLIFRETQGEPKTKNQKPKTKSWRRFFPSWVYGRSFCDFCGKLISWHDNIPLFSFFILKGRCRSCRHKISWQYPIVEFLTGIEFVWLYFLTKSNLELFSRFEGFYSFAILFVWFLLGASFLAIFVADFRFMIVPDSAIAMGVVAGILKLYFDYRYTGMADFSVIYAAVLACLFFLMLFLFTRGSGLGFGDVKLGFVLGLNLGFPKILVGIFFGFLLGALIGVILVFLRVKKARSKIAFGPFLIIGSIIALFFGNLIWRWYIGLLFRSY